MPEVLLGDLQATLDLGRRLGAAVQPGDVVLLEGGLGAGKTVLVRGLAAGAGSSDPVVSPTFVLVRHYAARLPVVHADLYRLESEAAVDRLGLLELSDGGVLVVEWPERAPSLAAAATLRLELVPGPTATSRTARVLAALPHLERAVTSPTGPA